MSVIIKLLSKFDDSGLRKAKSGFGGFSKSIGALGIGIGLKQISDSLMDIVTLASNAAEQTAAVGQIFGKAGAAAIQNFASTANTELGQTSTQVLTASKTFGIFGKAAGLASKDNALFSTSLITLATDLASFNNTSVDDAINALGAGLRGESEPLRRYGVLLTDKIVKDKGMAMGLGTMTKTAKGFTFTMTEQEKILARNAVILEQTSTQQGDFTRTSGGLANQQRILTASFEEAKTTLGTALLPMFTTFVTYLNDKVIPVVQQFVEDISDPKTEAGKMFTNIKTAVENTFKGVQDFFALFGDGDAMKGFGVLVSNLVSALPALLALKGIMMLASGGKAIAGLIAAMTAIRGGTPVGGVPGVAGGINPITAIAVGSGVATYAASQAAQASIDPGLKAKSLTVNVTAATFTGAMALPYDPSNPFILGGKRSVPNVTINVLNADPKATVDALGRYIKQNGSLPFSFATGRAAR